MGGLLVVMLVVLLGGIVWKANTRPPEEPPKTKLVELATPAGAQVQSVAVDGDRIVIHVTSSGSHEIIIVDTRKAQVLSRVVLKPREP